MSRPYLKLIDEPKGKAAVSGCSKVSVGEVRYLEL
jgi:hypothetical protein